MGKLALLAVSTLVLHFSANVFPTANVIFLLFAVTDDAFVVFACFMATCRVLDFAR